jgi:uncharacterized protein (TIGR03437 family)
MKAVRIWVAAAWAAVPLAGAQATRRPLDLAELQVPPGFEIAIHARGLGSARMLAFSPTGVLFVSDAGGRVRAVPEPDRVVVFASGLRQPHGLAFRDNDLYVAENHRIVLFRNATHPSLSGGTPEQVAELPGGGGHSTRTILWDADGRLVATAGSTCNICNETDPRRAAAMRFNPDGSGMEIFSRGLRNTVGIALHPVTGEIWGTDNGGDNLGEDLPPEEINILRAGRDYGWPRCYGDGGRYAGYNGECGFQTAPELAMQAHSAPLGIGFYTGEQFPARYQNEAFVAFHGSWNRDVPTGYKVVRILASSGRAQGIEDFLTGFLRGTTTSGRPVHAISGPDGALYVSDDMNGVVYRVSYTGPRINPGGLVSAAGAGIRVAAGGLASLYGSGFGDPPEDVQVTINGAPATLFYAGPQQINFLIPPGVQGRVTLAVTNKRGTDTLEADVARIAPAIFSNGIVQNGRALEIYCTGLGDAEGVRVTIGGGEAEVLFAGQAPGFAGLNQVNALIPAGVGTGRRAAVTVTAGGITSNIVEVLLN